MPSSERLSMDTEPAGPEGLESDGSMSILQEAVVMDLGSIKDVTLGSSASGSADANSQYYW